MPILLVPACYTSEKTKEITLGEVEGREDEDILVVTSMKEVRLLFSALLGCDGAGGGKDGRS